MVDQLVYEVRSENSNIKISHSAIKSTTKSIKAKAKKGIIRLACPQCKKGHILKGKTAYGCSRYKENCNFKLPFVFKGKKVSENQYMRLLQKGSTVNLKGFKTDNGKRDGMLIFDDSFNLVLKEKESTTENSAKKDSISCPKCKKGTVIKGKTAYGCSAYKNGCDFRFSFDKIREKSKGKSLTKDLVISLLNDYY
jgi:DNA topoisomerase-3